MALGMQAANRGGIAASGIAAAAVIASEIGKSQAVEVRGSRRI